jgi:hypothetical protein
MWLFGGSITWSKSWVNIAAAKKATARSAQQRRPLSHRYVDARLLHQSRRRQALNRGARAGSSADIFKAAAICCAELLANRPGAISKGWS